MDFSSTIASGNSFLALPSWGRAFWQDPNDGNLILLYASGTNEVDFSYSSDSGVTWSAPEFAFPVDGFDVHNNFDTEMDRAGNVHCVFRYNDSGCYQFVAKDFSTGAWAPSGVGPAGFCRAGDTGNAKGFQGNIMVLDEAIINNPPVDQSNLPHLFIAAKNNEDAVGLFHLHNPFSHTPSGMYPPSDEVPANISGCGPNGGFPYLVDNAPSADTEKGLKVFFRVEESGIMSISRAFNTWAYRYQPYPSGGAVNVDTDSSFNNSADELEFGGVYSRLLPNENMVHNRCGGEKNWLTIIPNKDYKPDFPQLVPGGSLPPWDFLCSDFHAFIDSDEAGVISDSAFNTSDIYVNLRGTRGYSTTQPLTPILTSVGIPTSVEIPSDNLIGRPYASGTHCDISWRDVDRRIHVYYLNRDSAGAQVVSRVMCDVRDMGRTSSDSLDTLKFSFSEILAPTSGVRSWASVSMDLVGGSGNKFAWNGFKALHHPTPQNSGVTKQEVVATVGVNPTGVFTIKAWDYDKSIDATSSLRLPVYSSERTQPTGSTGPLLSIQANGFDPSNLFDDDTTTSSNVSRGDTLTLGFDKPYSFSRVEFLWRSPDFGGKRLPAVDIQTSYNGVDFSKASIIPTGISIEPQDFSFPQPTYPDRLVKTSAEIEHGFDDTTISTGILPFTGKFVRFLFSDNTSWADNVPVYQVRMYGPWQTPLKWSTEEFEKSKVLTTASVVSYTQNFSTTRDSLLPPGWRTYGDWNWFVRSSGDLSKETSLPSEVAPQNGFVPSGAFAGEPNGNGDGFAIRTAEWIPLNSSGILEKDIVVDSTETTNNGSPGRTISWTTRYKLFGQGLLTNGPEDDSLRFFVVPNASGTGIEVSNFHVQQNQYVNIANYYTVSTNIDPGNWTLRWVYKRGSTPVSSPYPGDESVAYIDNVDGAEGIPITTIFGYLASNASTSGSIYGFLKQTKVDSSVNAYASGLGLFDFHINAFVEGAPNAFSSIYSYLLSNKESSVYGHTLGGAGLRSFPTGSVYSYVNVPSGAFSSTYGYLLPMRKSEVYSYLAAHTGIDSGSGIFGFVKVPDAASEVYGGVNLGATGVFSTVYGYLANRAFSQVYGYLKNEGSSSSIYGHMAPQNISSVYGYIASLGSSTGSINSYMKVSDVQGSINGFLLSNIDPIPSGQNEIYGYLLNDGVSEFVYGYLNTLSSEEVYSYLQGAEFASGSINAFTSGIGYDNSEVYGYLAGISGTASGSINGYMLAAATKASVVLGTLIGIPDATDSLDACPNHGSIPLPTVNPATIPSSCFNT